MIQTILVPTDFTDTAVEAARWAEHLALMTGARVLVLHVIEPVLLPGTEDDPDLQTFSDELQSKAEHKVAELVEVFRAADVRAEGRVLVGHAFETLENFAAEVGADLLVLGTHTLRQDDQEATFGTLSHKLFFLSKLPVLFVRP